MGILFRDRRGTNRIQAGYIRVKNEGKVQGNKVVISDTDLDIDWIQSGGAEKKFSRILKKG
jgi:hypothetical protein